MVNVIGGIGLFLLGMMMLTDGLKELAGDALKKWLNRFTGGTLSSVASGTFMTILMQSSTATTLLTIGFVSAGLLTFTQSIGVIIGANIGSTSTGWIISLIGFKISLAAMSLPLIGIGVLTQFIAPRDFKAYGGIVTGFGLLFYGIDVLQTGMEAAQDLIAFDTFTSGTWSGKMILIIIGIFMTIVMQASSASMAATLTALFAGAIDFEQAVYLVIGQNVGTTATAMFVAIGASVAAKRTAMTHLLFNVITAIVITLTAPFVIYITKTITTTMIGSFDETIGLAIFHTLFSLIGAFIFIPLIQPFAKLIMRIVKEKENTLTEHLNPEIISVPAIALDVTYTTLIAITRETTDFVLQLIAKPKMTEQAERQLQLIEEALEETSQFLGSIPSDTKKDRAKHIELLHTIDHLNRLIRVVTEAGMIESSIVKNQLNEKWVDVFVDMKMRLQEEGELQQVATILKEASTQMASERKRRREEYFERTASNETNIEEAIAKVEAVLWIDRLIYHYWRGTTRLQNYVDLNTKPSN